MLESVFQIMGPLISVWSLRGEEQQRMGSQIPFTVPRGVYECSDGKFLGVSTSSDTVARRVMTLLGFDGDDRFATFQGRVEHREILHEAMQKWCATRTQQQAMNDLEQAEAAAGPILSMSEIARDPHYSARDAIVSVDGTPMQGLLAKLSATPGLLRWAGRRADADGDDIRRNGWGNDEA